MHISQFYRKAKDLGDFSMFPVRKVRDLTLLDLFDDFSLVIACDSDGAIGSKPNDVIKISNYALGRFAARVPLMEILCSGAVPLTVVDTLSVEMNPTGQEIIEGIVDEMVAAGIQSKDVITGSTEDNIPTLQTGIGVVVIGLVHSKDFRPGKSEAGDIVVCIGLPKSGPDDHISLDDQEIISLASLRALNRIDLIHDLLPVGSRGIAYESSLLADTAELNFIREKEVTIDIGKSAGPSTCILATLAEQHLSEIRKIVRHPIHLIGYLSHGTCHC